MSRAVPAVTLCLTSEPTHFPVLYKATSGRGSGEVACLRRQCSEGAEIWALNANPKPQGGDSGTWPSTEESKLFASNPFSPPSLSIGKRLKDICATYKIKEGGVDSGEHVAPQ